MADFVRAAPIYEVTIEDADSVTFIDADEIDDDKTYQIAVDVNYLNQQSVTLNDTNLKHTVGTQPIYNITATGADDTIRFGWEDDSNESIEAWYSGASAVPTIGALGGHNGDLSNYVEFYFEVTSGAGDITFEWYEDFEAIVTDVSEI